MVEPRETAHTTTVIHERRGGGGMAIVALLAVIVIAVLGYMILANDTRETNAVEGAAQSVSAAADQVGDAAAGAVKGK